MPFLGIVWEGAGFDQCQQKTGCKTSNSVCFGFVCEGVGFDQCRQKTGCETSNSVCFGFVCEGVGFDQCQQKLVTAVSDCALLVLCVKVLDLTSITKNWLHLQK